MTKPRLIALIPARSGSKRLSDKNILRLGEHPLLAYAIAGAQASGLFETVLVSTDSTHYADIARHYGAEVPFLRPAALAGPLSADIEWVEQALHFLKTIGRHFDAFSILRPTNPFRLPTTIQRAWQAFSTEEGVDSLRAVEKCQQHPGKMWTVQGKRMVPLLSLSPSETPWHSSQTAALPEVFVQNASLEIAWSRVVFEGHSIAGNVVMPFFTEGFEGLDINYIEDFTRAAELLRLGKAVLPQVPQSPYPLPKTS